MPRLGTRNLSPQASRTLVVLAASANVTKPATIHRFGTYSSFKPTAVQTSPRL
jgi:hypothetical protein